MSRSAALFWVLIATLLGTAVWATTPRDRAVAAESPLLPDFSISACERLTIAWPGGQSAVIERGPLDGMWLLKSASGGQAPIAWPAENGRMQGLLRLLGELRTVTSPNPSEPMPKAVLLTIEQKNAPAIRLAVDPSTLGGNGRIVRVDESARVQAIGRVAETFVRALDQSAIESWRTIDLLPWAPESSVSFRSTSSAGETDLVRAGNGWIMQAPISTKADAGAVQGVLLLLSKASFERFLPPSASDETGFIPPARKILIGARPNGLNSNNFNRDSRIEMLLEVGPLLDAGARIVRASARSEGNSSSLWGPLYGVVDSSILAAINEDAAAYISRISVDLSPADISQIEFGSKGTPLLRDAKGSFGAADATVREFLRLLCETPSASTSLLPTAAVNEAADLTEVRLLGPKGETLKTVRVRTSSMPSKVAGSPPTAVLEVTEGRIVRLLPAQRPRDILAAIAGVSGAH